LSAIPRGGKLVLKKKENGTPSSSEGLSGIKKKTNKKTGLEKLVTRKIFF